MGILTVGRYFVLGAWYFVLGGPKFQLQLIDLPMSTIGAEEGSQGRVRAKRSTTPLDPRD